MTWLSLPNSHNIKKSKYFVILSLVHFFELPVNLTKCFLLSTPFSSPFVFFLRSDLNDIKHDRKRGRNDTEQDRMYTNRIPVSTVKSNWSTYPRDNFMWLQLFYNDEEFTNKYGTGLSLRDCSRDYF